MTGFAGWSLFGNLSAVLFTQGLNMLLNVFFGPVVNAARAVAVQVQNAIQQFVGNFQMALNPQITKTYAQGKMEEMHTLMFRSARFSFFLLFFLSLPVLFETEYILKVWLKTVPDNTVTFLRIMICTSLIYTCANPMIIANQATGKVKKYQAVCGSTLILILPISWILLALGFPAYSVFIVHFVMEGVCQLARMIMLRPLIGLRLRDYFWNIYSRVAIVVAAAVILPWLVYISMPEGFLRFLTIGFVCVVSVSSSAYLLGLSSGERVFIHAKVIAFKNKISKKY
ncbi:MAG: MATE family efflux transporter, partial [Lachnospiraceae bacterium]